MWDPRNVKKIIWDNMNQSVYSKTCCILVFGNILLSYFSLAHPYSLLYKGKDKGAWCTTHYTLTVVGRARDRFPRTSLDKLKAGL